MIQLKLSLRRVRDNHVIKIIPRIWEWIGTTPSQQLSDDDLIDFKCTTTQVRYPPLLSSGDTFPGTNGINTLFIFRQSPKKASLIEFLLEKDFPSVEERPNSSDSASHYTNLISYAVGRKPFVSELQKLRELQQIEMEVEA
jgi:hypothetical protein